jgi:ribosomal protein S18 acetylase RimI-like enzyme
MRPAPLTQAAVFMPTSSPARHSEAAAPTALRLRVATRDDVAALTALEERCFAADRLSRRSFQRLVQRETAYLLLAESEDDTLLGYCLILFHRGTSLARLYSIAVDPAARGRRVAEQLLARAEAETANRGRVFMRLEVHVDNVAAIRLYEKLGYKRFGVYHDYYEDHGDALRLQKRVLPYPYDAQHRQVPFYTQTTEFSCGPAGLMMAMAALTPHYRANRSDELRIWRDATTIFMTSGHGGCGPHGLALAAWRRGYRARVMVSRDGPLFTEGVRRAEKKSVLLQVHQDFLDDLASTDVEVVTAAVDIRALREGIEAGEIPLVLISTWVYDQCKAPHWVVVTAVDDRFVYIHDPDVDEKQHRSAFDNEYLPIEHDTFARSMQFGRERLRTALFVGLRSEPLQPAGLVQAADR